MQPVQRTVRLEDVCPFCGRRCRVPLSRSMPEHVIVAYDARGLYSMATCPEGATAENRTLNVSYADVIADRAARARAQNGADGVATPEAGGTGG